MENIESFENFNEKNWIKDAIKKPGALRKSLGKKEGDKITKGEINSEISKLKKKDKDKDKPGIQLNKRDRTKYKRLALTRTLRSMNENMYDFDDRQIEDISNSQIMNQVASSKKWGYENSYELLSEQQSHDELTNYISDCMDMIRGRSISENLNENSEEHIDQENYMFFNNLKTIQKMTDDLLKMDETVIDELLNEHDWAVDHISTSKDDIEEVFNFITNEIKKW